MSRPFLLANHLGDPCIVCASRERGLSLAEIAAAVEISASVIRLHTLHIETPRKRAAKEARVLLAQGMPYRAIMARTGIVPAQLAKINRRYGLSERHVGRPGIAA